MGYLEASFARWMHNLFRRTHVSSVKVSAQTRHFEWTLSVFASEIERKISMRTSREELIRKGVIREPDGTYNHSTPKIGKFPQVLFFIVGKLVSFTSYVEYCLVYCRTLPCCMLYHVYTVVLQLLLFIYIQLYYLNLVISQFFVYILVVIINIFSFKFSCLAEF